MPAGPRLARRTTLALAAGPLVGLVAVAGCDDGGDGSPAASRTATQPPEPDVELVDGVLEELGGALRVAAAAEMADLVALHRAHIEALDGTPPTPLTPSTRSPRRPADAATVRRRERLLHAHLVEAAVAAESGALARLLASMSAAVAQRTTPQAARG